MGMKMIPRIDQEDTYPIETEIESIAPSFQRFSVSFLSLRGTAHR